jgi:uncharacterized membrane protein YfcA
MEATSVWKLIFVVAAVLSAFVSETVVGFGATLFAVAVAGFVVPVPELLPIVVPANVLLSAYLTVRYLRYISWSYLMIRILPPLAIGVPLGFSIFTSRDSTMLQLGFGLFVALIAVFELVVSSNDKAGSQVRDRSLKAGTRIAILGAAGVAHGLFASGGPLVVYVAARDKLDKHQLRATLGALWLGVNVAMVAGYWLTGKIEKSTALAWPLMLPALLGGIAIGEWLHKRVDQRRFERAVFFLLGLAGIGLALIAYRAR